MKFKLPDVFNRGKIALLTKQVEELDKVVESQKGYLRGLATEASIWPGIAVSRPGARLTYETLNKCYLQSSAVRPAVDGIVREITTLPYSVEGFPGKNFDKGHKKAVEDLLHDPNQNKETFREILAKLLTDILVYDAAGCEKVKSPSGKLVELMARAGDTIVPIGDEHGVLQKYTQTVGGTAVDFEKDELIYMMLYPRAGSLWGTPIIEAIVDEIGTLLYSNEHVAKSFTEDEIPPGVLNLGEIGKEAYLAAKEDFRVKKGEKKDFKLRVVYGTKDVKWIDFKRPAREMQLDELRGSIERIVFRNFGVTPLELGLIQDINRSFDSMTQVITRDGFKFIKNIKEGEEVGTLNPKTLDFEWQKNVRKYVYNFKGKMIHFKSRHVDVMVTPNHKMLLSRYRCWREKKTRWDNLHFADASDVSSNFGFLRCPSGFKGEEKEVFEIPYIKGSVGFTNGATFETASVPIEDWMRFLGFYLSEGHLRIAHYKGGSDYKVQINQNEGSIAQKIRKNLSKIPCNVREYRNNGMVHFEISNKSLACCLESLGLKKKAFEKFIPTKFKNLSSKSLKILLNSLVLGDGWRGANRPEWRKKDQAGFYSTSSKKLADDVQEIAIKLGYEATIAKIGKPGPRVILGKESRCNHQLYQVYFRNSRYKYFNLVKKKHVKEVDYDGEVYCLEVPNHILVTRRNAKTCFHCNSTALMQMKVSQSRLIIPIRNMLSYYIDKEIIQDEFGFTDVHFVMHLRVYEDEDPESRSMERLVRSGIKSINQVCTEKGWSPVNGGDRRFIIVGKKILFIDELKGMKSNSLEGKS